ncbi:MAG TPA: glycoside hydrolase family 2 TIM barrel-domain containing protein, partial [Polyangiaceae bacterium]
VTSSSSPATRAATASTGSEASATTGSGGGSTSGPNGGSTSGATGGSPSSGGPRPGDGAVSVDGPQILVNEEPLHLRGVNWNPVPVGGSHPQDLAYAEFAAEDIALMQAAGINAVRTYEPLTDLGVLDALADAGIFVLNTVFPYGGNPASSVDAPVDAVKAHPAILLWVIGNEWNYNGLYVDLSLDASIELIDEVRGRIRDLDASHPIATVYGELPEASVLDRLGDIDVWGLNVYSGRSFGDRFTQWAERSQKPMFFGEYGADAWNATTGEYDPESQATATHDLTREILDHSTVTGGVCSGGTIFEFSDEWWKDQSGSASAQDVGGIAPGGGPFPDSTFNEEYWGIVTIERVPRPAYDVLKDLYSE